MCQMRVVLEHDAQEELIMENVSLLERTGAGIRVTALFEEPREVLAAIIHKIDFNSNTVTLVRDSEQGG
ncbi:MAG: CooT family nickel-binding protein [Desulfobacterales bacterium]|nr:CooT family nickel-binding protein [Desulfobacterales bacterium]